MPIEATFVDRPNRFVVRAGLEDGTIVAAHLANTARMTGLLEVGRPIVLEPADDPRRRTRYSVTRWWDGCWIGVEASRALPLLEDWIRARGRLGPIGPIHGLRREVPHERHRFDLLATTPSGEVWVEVKSASRAHGGAAPLSKTPSVRGSAHLASLAEIVRGGGRAAVAFVVQRPDVDRLMIGGDADPEWIRAVLAAREVGVEILAFGCSVTVETIAVDRPLAVETAND